MNEQMEPKNNKKLKKKKCNVMYLAFDNRKYIEK